MFSILKYAFLSLLMLAVISMSSVAVFNTGVLASNHIDCVAEKNETVLGIPKWYKYLDVEPDGSDRCTPQVNGMESLLPIGIVALEVMIRVSGLIAVVMIFIGAFKYILSQGNPDSAAGARKTVINAIIGLIIVIISTGLVSFLGARLGN